MVSEALSGKLESSSGRFTANSYGHCNAELTLSKISGVIVEGEETYEDYEEGEVEKVEDDAPLEAKLEKLKKLLEKGLITEEEAAAKRAKLLEDF